jgi:hypothetical protein
MLRYTTPITWCPDALTEWLTGWLTETCSHPPLQVAPKPRQQQAMAVVTTPPAAKSHRQSLVPAVAAAMSLFGGGTVTLAASAFKVGPAPASEDPPAVQCSMVGAAPPARAALEVPHACPSQPQPTGGCQATHRRDALRGGQRLWRPYLLPFGSCQWVPHCDPGVTLHVQSTACVPSHARLGAHLHRSGFVTGCTRTGALIPIGPVL